MKKNTKAFNKYESIMRYNGRDNTKKLWGLISIVVPLEKYEWIFCFFKKSYFEKIVKVFIIKTSMLIKTKMTMITRVIIIVMVVVIIVIIVRIIITVIMIMVITA